MSGTYLNKTASKLLKEASRHLIILDKGDYIHIGPYIMTERNTHYYLNSNKRETKFNNKKAAIAYAVSEFNLTTTQSRLIKRHDEKIGKYQDDITFHKRSLLNAIKSKDIIREDIMWTRLDAAQTLLRETKYHLMEEIKKVTIA